MAVNSYEGLCSGKLRSGIVSRQTTSKRVLIVRKKATDKVSVPAFLTQQTVVVIVRSAGWSVPGLGQLFCRTHFWQGAE